jgi:hypothetical protein
MWVEFSVLVNQGLDLLMVVVEKANEAKVAE